MHRLYDLGPPTTPSSRVFGGLLHQVYRLKTVRGDFALKLLNPTILRYPDVRDKFRLSERIAATVASAGLPAVAALPATSSLAAGATEPSVLHDIGGDAVMLYRWVQAKPNASFASAGVDRTRKIGSLLGRIHALPLHFAELQPPSAITETPASPELPELFNAEAAEWAALADAAERSDVNP